MKSTDNHQHLRWNPMLSEWILVCPNRAQRPWTGQEEMEKVKLSTMNACNPLKPGITRANGKVNPFYESTFVFDNDFPALKTNKNNNVDEGSSFSEDENDNLFKSAPAEGTCRVMCFHPKSDVTLATMNVAEIICVIEEWSRQTQELSLKYEWVQIFENKGSIMGCSNPHPHCQIWASKFLPNIPRRKQSSFEIYFAKHNSIMLLDYAAREMSSEHRIVCYNDDWLSVVPYWAVWPYETLIIPRKRHIPNIFSITHTEQRNLAEIMKLVLTKYDNLFMVDFPYSMGIHGAPSNSKCYAWQLHIMYYPPLLRSATIKKFMVGYEMMAMPQRDLTPEAAAHQLRQLSDVHYKQNKTA